VQYVTGALNYLACTRTSNFQPLSTIFTFTLYS